MRKEDHIPVMPSFHACITFLVSSLSDSPSTAERKGMEWLEGRWEGGTRAEKKKELMRKSSPTMLRKALCLLCSMPASCIIHA